MVRETIVTCFLSTGYRLAIDTGHFTTCIKEPPRNLTRKSAGVGHLDLRNCVFKRLGIISVNFNYNLLPPPSQKRIWFL